MLNSSMSRSALMLAALIVAGSFATLTALRLGGAPDQEPLQFVNSLSERSYPSVERGQQITAAQGEYLRYRFADGTEIFLDPNTVVRLDATAPTNKMTLIQGRLAVKGGRVTVTARNLALNAGECVLVHYSWLDLVDVTPLVAGGCTFADDTPTILDLMTTKFSTVDLRIVGVSNFIPSESSARGFFDWAGVMTAPPTVPVQEW